MRTTDIQIILEKEKKMAYKIDIKSLIIGLLAGIVMLLVLGAASGRNEGIYQLSMAASHETASGGEYVIYGRIHTGTGKIETWKYMLHTNNAVPHLGDNTRILLGPITKSLTN
jgi:hypothetical protein